MGDVMTILNQIAEDLEAVPGVQTCKVGLEPAISPADYPIIRVVPSKLSHAEAYPRRMIDLLIYYGATVQAFEGMDAVYDALCEMEQSIIDIMENGQGGYVAEFQETTTDEDRLETYKLFASRFWCRASN